MCRYAYNPRWLIAASMEGLEGIGFFLVAPLATFFSYGISVCAGMTLLVCWAAGAPIRGFEKTLSVLIKILVILILILLFTFVAGSLPSMDSIIRYILDVGVYIQFGR